MERFRPRPENSRGADFLPSNNQRKASTICEAVSRSPVRSKTISTSSDISQRLSTVNVDHGNRKTSTGSNSEYHFDTQDDSKYKGMVKDHYVSASSRSRCHQCNRKFSVKFRPHHCRRCGEIHCMKCLKYRRKLNRLANFDPNGKLRKVCKRCFNEETDTLGCTRNLMDEFCKERQLCKYERVLKQRAESLTTTFWRDQLDVQKECARLLDGFSNAVGTSEAKKTLSEIQELVKPPKWQKSSFWQVEKLAESCRACKGSLGIRKKKRNCKVCGLALCKKCSNRELLLYIENDEDEETQFERQPKMAVIKVAGCPEKEPDVSLLLHVCTDCKEYISMQQVTALQPNDCLSSLMKMDSQFTDLQDRISLSLSQCEQLFDSSELEESKVGCDPNNVSSFLNTLSIDLDTYERLFHSVKELEKVAETRMQRSLVKHYTMAKYEYYMEKRHTYRRLRNRTQPDQIKKVVPEQGREQSNGQSAKNEKIVISAPAGRMKDTDKTTNHGIANFVLENGIVDDSSAAVMTDFVSDETTNADNDKSRCCNLEKSSKQSSLIKGQITRNIIHSKTENFSGAAEAVVSDVIDTETIVAGLDDVETVNLGQKSKNPSFLKRKLTLRKKIYNESVTESHRNYNVSVKRSGEFIANSSRCSQTAKTKFKRSINNSDLIDQTECVPNSAVQADKRDQGQPMKDNLSRDEYSEAKRENRNERKSGEVRLNDGSVMWKR